MKCLLILSILIIFTFDAISTESDNVDVCNDVNQVEIINSCVNQFYNSTEFNIEFDITLTNYSGDDTAVYDFAAKYCPIFDEMLKCRLLGSVSDECLSPDSIKEGKQRHALFKSVVDFVCAYSGAVLVRIVEDNGLETIVDNLNFYSCLNILIQAQVAVVDTVESNTKMCTAIDDAISCYTNYVEDHKNTNLVAVANELKDVFRGVAECESNLLY